MKVRWTSGSIRFRITPSETNVMLAGETVEERLTFPGGGYWRGAIISVASETYIYFQDGVAEIAISQVDRQRLALPDAEGVYFKTDIEPSVYV